MSFEKTVIVTKNVETVTEALAFLMEHLDSAGDTPSLNITPVWEHVEDEDGEVGHKQSFLAALQFSETIEG